MLRFETVPIRFEDLPPVVQAGAAPDAPIERKMALAKAAIPLPPDDLLMVLSFLAGDRMDAVARTARETIDGLPWGVLASSIPNLTHAGVLDHLAREHGRTNENLWPMIAGNRNTADVTVAFIANKARGPVLELIAANQQRFHRFPMIVEALYYNAETRMGTVSTVMENAVRLGIDLSQIPGYQEIVASILGQEAADRLAGKGAPKAPHEAPAEPQPTPEAPVPPVVIPESEQAGTAQDELARLLAAADGQATAEGAAPGDPATPMDEGSFFALLQEAAAKAEGEGPEQPEEKERESAALWAKISKMTLPQKVRFALLGDEAARSMLIRDTRRMVYMSVLKSPRLTDKEIAGFAKSRNLNEEVIRYIASDRDWTKNYNVKLSLISNPKCPPNTAVNFLRVMTTKDVKHISGSRDVPGYIARQAKAILDNREQGKRN